MTPHPPVAAPCVSCGAALHGPFCHECGEKALHPGHDFSIRHFLEETVEGFLHLDSRLLRSLRGLLTRPGFLTAEFIAGRRVPYMKPLPLFFVIALIFYLFFPTASAFFSNPGDMNRSYANGGRIANTFHVNTPGMIAARAAAHHTDPDSFVVAVARDHAAPKSKAWLFVIVPAWALGLWALFGWRQRWLVPHLVFALHGLAFFMLADLIGLGVANGVFRLHQLGDDYLVVLLAAMTGWCVLAVRRAYGLRMVTAVPLGIAASAVFFLALDLYRQAITIWAIWVS